MTRHEVRMGDGRWLKVTPYIFRSWTGGRRIDGETYTGDVFVLGTDKIYGGKVSGEDARIRKARFKERMTGPPFRVVK